MHILCFFIDSWKISIVIHSYTGYSWIFSIVNIHSSPKAPRIPIGSPGALTSGFLVAGLEHLKTGARIQNNTLQNKGKKKQEPTFSENHILKTSEQYTVNGFYIFYVESSFAPSSGPWMHTQRWGCWTCANHVIWWGKRWNLPNSTAQIAQPLLRCPMDLRAWHVGDRWHPSVSCSAGHWQRKLYETTVKDMKVMWFISAISSGSTSLLRPAHQPALDKICSNPLSQEVAGECGGGLPSKLDTSRITTSHDISELHLAGKLTCCACYLPEFDLITWLEKETWHTHVYPMVYPRYTLWYPWNTQVPRKSNGTLA